MSGRIPQTFIDELVSRADIVDVVGQRVTLKKAGREYKANCPFHDEKTPSFTVSPDKGFYHCFGCGAHGTAIGFLMAYENLDFPDAVEALAGMLGLDVVREQGPDTAPEPGQDLYALLHEAEQLYRHALREHPAAVDYLKARGIQGTTAARFGLGYAPSQWDTVLGALGGTAERRTALESAGLVIAGERGKRYDRFRDRIMFPIRDHRGRTLGFGGRLLGPGEPKYLNSPETPLFHKGQTLYGLYEARQRGAARAGEIIVVEGYLDVASLAQAGVEPVVATLGTATTAEHVRRLTRLADRVVFCFDGDRAGRAAAWRALEAVLPFAGGTAQTHFLLLPEGEDPDSLVRREGSDAFRARVAASLPLSDFLVDELARQVDLDSVDGRARLTALCNPLLARLPEGIYRELLLARLAELVGLPSERFAGLLAAPRRTAPSTPPDATALAPPARSSLIRQAVGLTLDFPTIAGTLDIPVGLPQVAQPGAALLCRLLALCHGEPHITTAMLLERLRDDPEGRFLGRLAGQPSLEDEASAGKVLADTLERIVANYRRERLGQLMSRLRDLSPGERRELEDLQELRRASQSA